MNSRASMRGHRIEGLIQVVIMLAIGGAAGAASFTHVHDVAATHGQPGWLAWADAVVLELMSIASGLELRRRQRSGQPAGFPVAVLSVAVVLSLAAQVVEAEQSPIGWLAAALPAAGFLAMVKIAMGRSDHAAAPLAPTVRDRRPSPQAVPAGSGQVVRDRRRAVPDRALPVPDRTRPVPDSTPPNGVAEQLIPAARAAAEALTRDGETVSRQNLAVRLRADGHAMSNSTVSALLRHLRQHPQPPLAGDRTEAIPLLAQRKVHHDALTHPADTTTDELHPATTTAATGRQHPTNSG